MTNNKQPTNQLLESTCGSSKQTTYDHQRCGMKEDCKKLSVDFSHVSSALKTAQDEIEQLKSENYEIRCQRQSWMNRIDEATYTENSCLEQLKNIKEQNEQLKSEIEVLKYDNEQLTTKLSYFENGEN